jgi:hypothetical protein
LLIAWKLTVPGLGPAPLAPRVTVNQGNVLPAVEEVAVQVTPSQAWLPANAGVTTGVTVKV